MTKTHSYPFACTRCEQEPIDRFELYRPNPDVDDWLIIFPQDQLIHIHFGYSVQDDRLNTEEAKFVQHVLRKWAEAYPNKKFFIVVDGSRADDSEAVTEEARKIYMRILKDPQFGQGTFYGVRPGMSFFINLLLTATRKKIRLVDTQEQAEAEYRKWAAAQLEKI